MDPWAINNDANSSSASSAASFNDLNSDCYLWSLEAKLKRTKGVGVKEPVAKDIINGLHKIRESHMLQQSQETDNLPYISNSEYIEDFHPSAVGLIQRKLAPDKQALNAEELKVLVENDELEKMMTSNSCADKEASSSSEIDLQR